MTSRKNTTVHTQTTTTPERPMAGPVPPPSKHQLALMIWLCVFPTLAALNLVLGDWLGTLAPRVRTFVLATIAVPIVIYGLMPHLHRLRIRLLATRQAWTQQHEAAERQTV